MNPLASPHNQLLALGNESASITVAIPLYNYANYVIEALDSVADQTFPDLGVIVVDDASTDNSVAAVTEWIKANAHRFRYAMLLQHKCNQGLSRTRNTAIGTSESEYIFFLDADNRIYPRCIEQHAAALVADTATFAYSILEKFGDETGLMGTEVFSKERLRHGNYIDAMACIRRHALEQVGGYRVFEQGWEDYDLWLRFAERGYTGVQIPEILGSYRVHRQSMLRTNTNQRKSQAALFERFSNEYPWLELPRI